MSISLKCCLFVLLTTFFVLGSHERAQALPSLSDLKNKLAKAQQQLTAAKADVLKKTSQLQQAQAAVAKAKSDLDAAGAAIIKDKQIVTSRLSAMTNAHANLTAELNSITKLASSAKQAEQKADAALKKLLNTPITFFDMSWSVTVEYDLKSNGFNAWADMPKGMKLTSTQISSLFQGQLSFPTVNPLEMVDDCFGVSIQSKCDYDDVVKKFYRDAGPNDRVYVSTRGLSELFSAEQLTSSAAAAVFSGGSTIEGTTEEIAKGCLRELNAVYAFLQDAAKDEADDLMPKVVEAIFTRKEFTSPATTIQIKPFKASMTYTIIEAGQSDLPTYFPDLSPKMLKVKPLISPRFGFAVIVKNVGPRPTINNLRSTFGAAKAFGPAFLKKLGLPADVLQYALSDQGDISALVSAEMQKLFQTMDYSQIKPDPVNPTFLDLRSTKVGDTITTTLNKYLKPAYSMAKLQQLSINTETGQVVVIVNVETMYKDSLEKGMELMGKRVDDIAADVSKDWRAAASAVAMVEKELEAENAKLPGLNQVLKLSTDQYNSAQGDLKAAQNLQTSRQQIYNNAIALQSQANSALIAARNQVTSITNEITQLTKWIHQLEHPIKL